MGFVGVSDVLLYVSDGRADSARSALANACAATGATVHLEVYGTGSLYQRLGTRRAPPTPDIVWWFGPFAAQAAAIDGLLQAHQPSNVADGAVHAPDWKWTSVDYSAIGTIGASPVASWQDLARVPRLAIADPERSEVGLSVLLASLDRARQTEGDAELGWAWWRTRAAVGLVLAEDDAGALALVQDGSASHALTLSPNATPLSGLAPIPHALGLAASARAVEAARGVLDWLSSEAAAGSLALSAWRAGANGLASLLQAAPPLDVEWGRQQYAAARERWAASGFGPT
ncbi:MAG: extracellular solute-binding protein [Chloroflexi bacterium]|nr:extracellular solute-binding protein [Chloroflexota bacterium]